MTKEKEIISLNDKVELESEEISERIKNIKGVLYDDDSGILTVTEEFSYKRFREILYWLRMRGYGKFGESLRSLFRVTHNESFLKENAPELSSCGRLIIEGGNVFTGGHFLLPFWMEWECTINIKKGSETKSWDMLFFNFLEDTIESSIKSTMVKYIFEVYEENKCSFIYEVSAMLKKEKELLPDPFYEDIGYVLEEAKQALNNNNVFSSYGLKVKALCEKKLQPIQKLYPFKKPFSSLRLGEVKENVEGNETAEIYGPIFAKIGKALERTKREEMKTGNEESVMTGSKEKKEINIFPEKPSGEQIEIYPLWSRERFKNIKTILHPLLKFLLESNIQNEDIHWLYGFVIFPNWRKKTAREVDDPAKNFDNYISSLNGFGKKEMLWIIERKGEESDARHKKGYYDFRIRGFSSNIIEAYHAYEKSEEINEPSKKKNNLSIAWQKYPDLIKVNSALVDCWIRENFEEVADEEIKKISRFFEDKDYSYSQAYEFIVKKQEEKKMDYWDLPSVREVIRGLLEKSGEIKKYVRVLEHWLDKKNILSPDEIEYEKLKDLILLIREENKKNKEILELQNIPFQQLIQNLTVSSAVNIIKAKIRNEYSLSDDCVQKTIEPLERGFLWEIIMENRINFSNLFVLKDFKNWLIETLTQEIRNQINDGLLSVETWKQLKKQSKKEL